MNAEEISELLEPAVNGYLLAKACADTMRECVNDIARQILTEAPLTNGHETKHGDAPRLITDPDEVWLCDDDVLLQDYYAEKNARLRKSGLKPESMPDTHCPALVAEGVRSDAENALISLAWEQLKGVGAKIPARLFYGDDRRNFLDLLCKLVVNRPGYRQPKIAA